MLKNIVFGLLVVAISNISFAEEPKIENICQHFNDEGCFAQGQDFRNLAMEGKEYAGPEKTAQGAYDRFQLVCTRGHKEGCIYAVDTARVLLKNKKLEIQTYHTACENGQPKFCGAGYMSTAFPSKPNYDRKAAEFFAEKGCSLSDDYLCGQVEWQKENPVLDDAREYIKQ